MKIAQRILGPITKYKQLYVSNQGRAGAKLGLGLRLRLRIRAGVRVRAKAKD